MKAIEKAYARGKRQIAARPLYRMKIEPLARERMKCRSTVAPGAEPATH